MFLSIPMHVFKLDPVLEKPSCFANVFDKWLMILKLKPSKSDQDQSGNLSCML